MSRTAAAVDVGLVLALLAGMAALPAAPINPGRGWHLEAVVTGLVILAVVAFLLRRRGQGPAALGLRRAPLSRVLVAAIAALLLCYLIAMLAMLLLALIKPGGLVGLAREKERFLRAIGPIPAALVLPVSGFVGFYEEVLFRGFLLSRLLAVCRSRVLAVVVSSAIFGAMHFEQGLVGVAQTSAVGLVLAAVTVRTGTLWPAILTHAAIDTISLALGLLLDERLHDFAS